MKKLVGHAILILTLLLINFCIRLKVLFSLWIKPDLIGVLIAGAYLLILIAVVYAMARDKHGMLLIRSRLELA